MYNANLPKSKRQHNFNCTSAQQVEELGNSCGLKKYIKLF